jgi:hypothetical protein
MDRLIDILSSKLKYFIMDRKWLGGNNFLILASLIKKILSNE